MNNTAKTHKTTEYTQNQCALMIAHGRRVKASLLDDDDEDLENTNYC